MPIMNDKILNRVRALLAKAEATNFPEEAEALSAKAQELIIEHSIEAGQLDAEPSAIISKTYRWTDYKAIGKRRLVCTVAMALPGAYALYYTNTGVRGLHVVTVWADSEDKIKLIDSLLIQGESALSFWWKNSDSWFKDGGGMYAKKNNYLWGFGAGAATRFEQQVSNLQEEKALVLADASRRVKNFAEGSMVNPIRKGVKPSNNSFHGFHAGKIEGEGADIGGKMLSGKMT